MDDWKLLDDQQPPPGFEWLARQSTFLFLSLSHPGKSISTFFFLFFFFITDSKIGK
jgi:hypothetical protein